MARDGGGSPRCRLAEDSITRLARLAHRCAAAGRRDNCLERSLITFRYLSAANANPLLMIGADHGGAGVEGHVWLLVDGEPVADALDELSRFVSLAAFGRGGRLTAVPECATR